MKRRLKKEKKQTGNYVDMVKFYLHLKNSVKNKFVGPRVGEVDK